MSLLLGELSVLGAGSVFSSLHLLGPHTVTVVRAVCWLQTAATALAHEPFSSLLSGITHMFWTCPVTVSDQGYSSQLQ